MLFRSVSEEAVVETVETPVAEVEATESAVEETAEEAK